MILDNLIVFLYYYLNILVSNYLLTSIFIDRTRIIGLSEDISIPELIF